VDKDNEKKKRERRMPKLVLEKFTKETTDESGEKYPIRLIRATFGDRTAEFRKRVDAEKWGKEKRSEWKKRDLLDKQRGAARKVVERCAANLVLIREDASSAAGLFTPAMFGHLDQAIQQLEQYIEAAEVAVELVAEEGEK